MGKAISLQAGLNRSDDDVQTSGEGTLRGVIAPSSCVREILLGPPYSSQHSGRRRTVASFAR